MTAEFIVKCEKCKKKVNLDERFTEITEASKKQHHYISTANSY